jgi:hypothetical protein
MQKQNICCHNQLSRLLTLPTPDILRCDCHAGRIRYPITEQHHAGHRSRHLQQSITITILWCMALVKPRGKTPHDTPGQHASTTGS